MSLCLSYLRRCWRRKSALLGKQSNLHGALSSAQEWPLVGSGCCTDGRVVASDPIDLGSNPAVINFYIETLFTLIRKEKIKR